MFLPLVLKRRSLSSLHKLYTEFFWSEKRSSRLFWSDFIETISMQTKFYFQNVRVTDACTSLFWQARSASKFRSYKRSKMPFSSLLRLLLGSSSGMSLLPTAGLLGAGLPASVGDLNTVLFKSFWTINAEFFRRQLLLVYVVNFTNS